MRHATRKLILALAGGLLVAGCGDAAERLTEEAIEQGAGGDVDIDLDDDGGSFSVDTPEGEVEFDIDDDGDGSFTVEGEDGSFSSGSTDELPDDFPTEVFLPDSFEVESATRIDDAGETSISVAGSVDDDLEDLADQIESAYDEEPTQRSESPQTASLTYQNVDGFAVSYVASTQSDGAGFLNVTVRPAE